MGNRKRIHPGPSKSANNKGGAVSYTARSEGSAGSERAGSTSVRQAQATPGYRAGNSQLVLGLIDQLVLPDPRHHVAQLTTDRLDRVHRVQTPAGRHGRIVGTTFED